MNIRTDLAIEAKESWHESAGETTKLNGVEAWEKNESGFGVEYVAILDDEGAEQLGKPIGKYITIKIDDYIKNRNDSFSNAIKIISKYIRKLLANHAYNSTLVVGLGNSAITPDNLGPETVKSVIVTRHLLDQYPDDFASFRSVSAVLTGVLGTTGIESFEIIRSVASEIKPDVVLAIDSLVSRRLSRVCRTVQINDSGITPGSGIGNYRKALNTQTLGVPVIAIGIPTVVSSVTLVRDLMESAGVDGMKADGEFDMIVTPKDIDINISDGGKLLGYAINMALHDNLQEDEITAFLS